MKKIFLLFLATPFLLLSQSTDVKSINNDLVKSRNFVQLIQLDSAYFYANRSLIASKKIDDSILETKSLLLLSDIYFNKGDKNESGKFAEKGLKIATQNNDYENMQFANLILGNISFFNGAEDKALQFYRKIELIAEKTKKKNATLAKCYIQIGALLFRNNDPENKGLNQAETYFKKAIDVSIEIKNKETEIRGYSNYSRILAERGQFDESIALELKCYNYYKSVNNKLQLPNVLVGLGERYSSKGDFASAKKAYTECLEIYQKENNTDGLAKAHWAFGKLYSQFKNYDESLREYKQSISYFKQDEPVQYGALSVVTSEISDVFYQKGDYKSAFEYLDEYITIEQNLSRDALAISMKDLEAKYQTEKKEQQIKLLSTQNELAQKQKYIYIGLLGLLALIGGSLFYGYRNKIKTAQKLNELNELKSRFFANISHEFRTPLTLIKSPVQSLQSEISDANQKNKLNLIDTNSTRMLQLVDQLLELSKIDGGNLKLILKDGNISAFLTSIIEPFQFQSKEKGIDFKSNIQKTNENNAFDKDVIEKIVTNLVSNAFKYTPEKETISFTSSVENSTLQLKVSNTGSDVKKDDLPKLFERFYQKNETQQGVGIGLALVKELVELYKGTITTSVENGTLSFVVNLPLAAANENALVIPAKVSSSNIETPINNEAELPILLVVDDNAEIRSILKDLFKTDYKILEAQDGEEALQLAQKEIPDCIISDVMMPKMDGFEFTKAIKNNELTSFIPVVLLTAKTSDEAHLEGLKSTADAFLTKPFNNEIVKATVQQLIAERKKLHARYSQELVLRPVDIVINSAEEKFIERLQAILDKNLSNSEYTAEDFANEIGMSRMQLHRKLKSLLGVSATEFLRNERLKVGAELLKKGNGNISEIAYSVGFSDVSYFSKCFKEMYECTPTEYMENK